MDTDKILYKPASAVRMINDTFSRKATQVFTSCGDWDLENKEIEESKTSRLNHRVSQLNTRSMMWSFFFPSNQSSSEAQLAQ